MVLSGAKPALRTRVNALELEHVIPGLTALGLRACASWASICPSQQPARNGYSEWSSWVLPRGKLSESRYLYVAKSLKLCEQLRRFDCEGRNIDLGLALGYPRCCAEHFHDEIVQDSRKDPLFRIYSHGQSAPWPMNVALLSHGFALLSHFPCSASCGESLALASERFDSLFLFSREGALRTASCLATVVIHTRSLGTAAVRGRSEDGQLSIDERLCSPPQDFALERSTRVGMSLEISSDGCRLDGLSLLGSEVLVVRFS